MSGKFRKLPNGSLSATRRGKAPPAPTGYFQDPKNPYVYHPILEDCDYREKRPPDIKCCGASSYLYCNYFKKKVTRGICHECPISKCNDASI